MVSSFLSGSSVFLRSNLFHSGCAERVTAPCWRGGRDDIYTHRCCRGAGCVSDQINENVENLNYSTHNMFTHPAYVYKIPKILKDHAQNVAYLECESQSNSQYNDFDSATIETLQDYHLTPLYHTHTDYTPLIHVHVCCHSNISSEEEGIVLLPSGWRYKKCSMSKTA